MFDGEPIDSHGSYCRLYITFRMQDTSLDIFVDLHLNAKRNLESQLRGPLLPRVIVQQPLTSILQKDSKYF